MSWPSSQTLLPTVLVVCAALAWWFTEPKTAHLNLIVSIGFGLFFWAVAPGLAREVSANIYAYCMTTITQSSLDTFVADNATMLLTGAAVVWLLRRAVQTLWKPVPELINILGVDVPDAPDVMLAGIGVDKATVNWARPQPNKPVQKFLIQVNGVVVGESPANQETAITVTGLKPNHFYNVRVIAVGSNNFQAGSRVIRLRTFGRDGRPQLGNARLPPNFEPEDPPSSAHGDHGDENGGPRSPIPSIETATIPDGAPSLPRETSSSGAGPRRNTIGRKHSPSTGSMDHKSARKDSTGQSEAEIRELGEKFDAIRKEAEETAALIAREEEENKKLLDELEQDKKLKKADQKKKEEQTEKLKRELGATDRAMRSTLQRKAQKEKELKSKQADRARYHDNMVKWEKQIAGWRKEQESFLEQRKSLEDGGNEKKQCLREGNESLQQECSRLEAELKEKREQVKQLEDDRKKLPGGDDDAEWREQIVELRRDHQRREREWQLKLFQEGRRAKYLDDNLHILENQLQQIPQASYAFYNQANSSNVDFDNTTQLKRRSRNSNSFSNMAPSPALPFSTTADASVAQSTGFSTARVPPGFAQGPFMDFSADMPDGLDEAAIQALTAGAPLSPSATALLPKDIFADLDDDPPSPTSHLSRQSPFEAAQPASPERDPQSPASSHRSIGVFSSPHGSTQNLPFPQLTSDNSERRSLNSFTGNFSSPNMAPGQPITNKLTGLFSFQRSKTAKVPEEGPALGSLKTGQSQSFPRQTDEPDAKRRISLSSWNVFNRNSVGPDTLDTYPAPGTRGFSARNLLAFGSRGTSGVFAERNPGSPRPASIASAELPRPSTDSGSIWGPHHDFGKSSRMWPIGSPDNGWSRNPSRRPSIHGSPSALKTTLASAEDEILDEEALLDPQVSPSQVGVIGSRPPVSKKALAKALNPNAPSFMGNIFRPKTDKDKEKDEKILDKARSKEAKGLSKERSKDAKDKLKGPTSNPDTPSLDESPSDSRMSRDTFSVHTQTSVSESRESLTLDRSISNTPSEPTSTGLAPNFNKENPDNVVRKLFRKGSSSKFSFSSRLGKKGPGSTTNSDKNMSAERSSIGDLEDLGDEAGLGRSYDSVTSSPSLGPSTSLGPSRSKDKPESRMANWGARFSMKKKGKEKESLDIDRDKLPEIEVTTEDERAK
ncbi:putative fibronectin type iii domain-containing protein [Phaeoacremonium minimum UCRPA7]|uniref:Putative fibronectin type iii domain-containing protein n=1 Tax=Phaeoacremonium minimum (strain UCR-PA7) TaxID=1286976 RepID=R8BG90_PHAM7|nr:putative fibronectin type iii domain-containing protein [Phaeoacremonium minimum UCRPA7]EON98315.1 putative fibronectin type iii domain-containing protein [Phaeoacremonium minimum UCRPA7]